MQNMNEILTRLSIQLAYTVRLSYGLEKDVADDSREGEKVTMNNRVNLPSENRADI